MRRTIAFALLLVLLVACGGGETPQATTSSAAPKAAAPVPPTIEQATRVIADSPELGEFEFTNAAITIPLQKSAMNEPS